MLSSTMLLLNLILLIDVTFSTPTPDFVNYGKRRAFVNDGKRRALRTTSHLRQRVGAILQAMLPEKAVQLDMAANRRRRALLWNFSTRTHGRIGS